MSPDQRVAIDAELRSIPLLSGDVEQERTVFAAFASTMHVPEGIRTAEGRLAGLRTLEIDPVGERRAGTILYFHGGAWVVGSPETALGLTASLVVRTGVRAISVDYRLAPEHPFPAAVDDGLAAYRALLDAGERPGSIVIAGDSAGGGLAMTTLLAAKRAGLPMPGAYIGFSAGLDQTRSGQSMWTKHGIDPLFTREALAASGTRYLAGRDPHDELLAPAIYADAAGLPPLLLQAGTNEVLLDDTTRMARRAWDAGVDVVLDITAGVPHVFQMYTGRLDEANAALDRAAQFLLQRIG